MKVERAQPQTIEAKDGFPIENLKFCGGAQEVMAVIQGYKPVAITSVDKNYIHMDLFTSLQSKKKKVPPYHECKPYTYEQVYNASKDVNLLRSVMKVDNDILYYYFLKENIIDAYLFTTLWENRFERERYNVNEDEFHIMIGILLGYKKKDIRAWFCMEIQDLFHINFDNLDERPSILRNASIRKKRDEIAAEFEQQWSSAVKKLNQIKKETSVPPAWKKALQKLPAPKSRRTTRKQKGGT